MAKGKKTGGRQKGSVNKVTATVKAAFKEAFDELGGVPALVGWARSNETEFYKLASKLIPTEIANPQGEAFKLESALPDEDRALLDHFIKTRGKS